MKNLLFMIFVLLFISNSYGQVIGYGERLVIIDLGLPETERYEADTLVMEFDKGKITLWMLDGKVVRQQGHLTRFNLWRSERNFRRHWNRIDHEWYFVGINQCRIIEEQRIFECVKYERKTLTK